MVKKHHKKHPKTQAKKARPSKSGKKRGPGEDMNQIAARVVRDATEGR